MKPLLKDLPGFAETIDNNTTLLSKIRDHLADIEVENNFDTISDTIISSIAKSLEGAEFIIKNGNEIEIDDRQLLAQTIWGNIEDDLTNQEDFIVQNDNQLSLFILNDVTEFVNENYQLKK